MNICTFIAILSRNPQYDFPKMRGGGGPKAVWNFSENSSILVGFNVRKNAISDGSSTMVGMGWDGMDHRLGWGSEHIMVLWIGMQWITRWGEV